MNVRTTGPVAGVLGGLCWVAAWGADLAGSSPSWGSAARWAGLALLLVALASVGAGLVSRSATWLRALVAVAFPLLVWSVYSVVRGEGDGVLLDGLLGVVAVVASAVALLTSRRPAPTETRTRTGSHAAR